MIVIAADGSPVQPVPVDEFRMGIGETYDVVVIPDGDKAYTIFAESIDRSGYVRATLAPREGMSAEIPQMHPRALLSMADMGAMPGMDHGGGDMAGMDHGATGHDMAGMDHAAMGHDPAVAEEAQAMGWEAGSPPDSKVLSYADLKALVPNADTRPPVREITVTLGGNMERYIWLLNGKPFEDSDPIELTYGERVRITCICTDRMCWPRTASRRSACRPSMSSSCRRARR